MRNVLHVMGDYIVIEHQIGPFEFACESVSTGTPFIARIDDDKHQIFLDHAFSISTRLPAGFFGLTGDLNGA